MFQLIKTSLMMAILFIITSSIAVAQTSISGKVLDAQTKEPLAGASVFVKGTTTGTSTNKEGEFTLSLPEKTGLISVSFVGYKTKEIQPDIQNEMIIYLEPSVSMEEMIIKGVRAESTDPVAQSTIEKAELEQSYKGEHPVFFLEELTPSIISFSESGTKLANYGSMRLRGISQERINFTLNGVPLNDMIDHGVFFSNFSDIGNSFESVQVQRGVGTSSNGAASYAGSVNFESVNLENREQDGEIGFGAGAFETYRLNGNISSGMIDNKWSFFGNYSRIFSEGYRNNTSTNSYSFFFSAGYFGEKNLVKLNIFDARSRNGLGYSAVALSDLEADPRTNYLNENDKDDFGQRFVQLQHTHIFSENWKSTSSLYYGGASGDFLFTFADSPTTFAQINFPLQNDHYGLISNIFYEDEDWDISSGIHLYQFDRTNEESVTPDFANPYYFETSDKKEISWFSKAERAFGDISLFGEVQIRYTKLSIQPDYDFIGIAPEGDIVKDWTFINPKIGINYTINENLSTYASVGRTGREPTKIDIFSGGFSLTADNYDEARADGFKAEYVNDFEAGLRFSNQKASVGVNLFYMDFENEIAPIGQELAFGVQRRENIPNSYRTGVELDWNLLPIEKFAYQGTLTYMKSEIDSFTDGGGNTFENTTPILSPEWIINNTLKLFATNELTFSISGNYVSESFLELSNDPDLILPDYFVMDAAVNYENDRFRIRFELNNLTDKEYYSNGAPVDVDFDGTIDEPGYFVNAPRSVFGSVAVKF